MKLKSRGQGQGLGVRVKRQVRKITAKGVKIRASVLEDVAGRASLLLLKSSNAACHYHRPHCQNHQPHRQAFTANRLIWKVRRM